MSPTNVEAPWGSIQLIQLMRRVSSGGLRSEGELGGRGAVFGDRHFHRLGAELLVPGFQLVGAGRQPLDAEGPVLARGGEKRMAQDPDAGMHPPVDGTF